MFRFVPRFAAVLLLVAAVTLAPAAAKERPFKASGDGYVSGGLFGKGNATHLGRTSLDLNAYTYLLDYGTFAPFGGGRFTSASGDELHFVFDAAHYNVDIETGVVLARVTFSGGTGRFADATGSADMMFDLDVYLFFFSFQFDGSIDY